ncbi:MAG: preprotein translocase subunit YajC [Treponema sp.]|nr:preprotein translocase subunit YajC [Treponema sp.]
MNSLLSSLGPMFRLMGAPPQEGGNAFMSFLPLIAIIGIFYFLIIRPQSKKQKETQKMLSALRKGDRIVTVGGLHGIIQSIKENTVIVRVDENTKLEFNRGAIATVTSNTRDEKEDDTPEKEDKDE